MKYKRFIIGASLLATGSYFFIFGSIDKKNKVFYEPNSKLNELIDVMEERDKVYFLKNSINTLSEENKAEVSKYILDNYVKYNSDISSRVYVLTNYLQNKFSKDEDIKKENVESLSYLLGGKK